MLIVEIPQSPHGPHMVDGRYYARTERGVRVLSNAEVEHYHQQRATAAENIHRALGRALGRFGGAPNPLAVHRGRLVVAVEPVPVHRTDLMTAVFQPDTYGQWVKSAIDQARAFVGTQTSDSPTLTRVRYAGGYDPFDMLGQAHTRHADGVACRGGGLRIEQELTFACLEFDYSGALRFALNNLVSTHERGDRVLYWRRAISATLFALGAYAAVCRKAGVRGSADIALHLDNLQDAKAEPVVELGSPRWDRVSAYTEPVYKATTRVTPTEIEGDLGPAMVRLWAALLTSPGIGEQLTPG